jgi:glycosyltransferase involved in cell wall biosynthesis
VTAPELRAYEKARAAVLAMTHAGGPGASHGVADPSAYWREELANIDYMIEATPLILRKLRHHAFHVTGIRPYDYRSKDDARREYFEARLRALRDVGGDALLVPESPILGGFGYEIDGRLYNVDTLKFYEVLIGMERSGVLAALRAAPRPLVCEIGAGWGGFAYQFKTLFPSSTYVIVDFPELFLYSATYLATAFPDARVLFAGDGGSIDGWRDADFVFVPQTNADLVSSLPLDATVNMVSFQEMTEAQVRGYAEMAARAGCPLLYSLNRERSPYNTELSRVSAVLAERYQLSDVTVLGSDYTSAMKRPPRDGKRQERSELGYRHLVGRLATMPARTADGVESGFSRIPVKTDAPRSPRVALGMTLYNKAEYLREALDSLLTQTYGDFLLVLLDDASHDGTEAIAREYEARDPRVRYFRHAERQAMIATWSEVAGIARRECPSAEYFAWVSDHDRWHPQWLARLVETLDADPGAVLAYPQTRRLEREGSEIDKRPRLFETTAGADRQERWRQFCRYGIGAGDMVYGLMRFEALRTAGTFRRVLRPDRLLIAELTLIGHIRQVPETLWFRRNVGNASIERQPQTLVRAGDEPRWFTAPPAFQHAVVLWRHYVREKPRPLPIGRAAWIAMILRYQMFYVWRTFRKSETSRAIDRAFDGAQWLKKQVRHHYHHLVYHALVGSRVVWTRTVRFARHAVYEGLMFAHRLGLPHRRRGAS